MRLLFLFLCLLGPVEAADAVSPWTRGVVSASRQPSVGADSVFSVVSMGYSYAWVAERQAWHRRKATLRTSLGPGDLVTSVVQQRRFGRNEVSGQVHYWPRLWGDAYGHVSASLAPNAQTMPRVSLGVEVYEVMGHWEVTGFYEWRRYVNGTVHLMGPQIAWYVDDWYLRTRTSVIERDGLWNVTQILGARRYLGSSSSYLDGQVGYGRTVDLLQPGLPLQRSRGYFASLRLQMFVTSTLGFSLGGTYSDDVLRRARGAVGLLARW